MAPAAPAAAHTEVIESRPSPGEALPEGPGEIVLVASGALAPGSEIQVLDAGFRRVDVGETAIDEGVPPRLRVGLAPLAPGEYTVVWRAVDPVDQHEAVGSFPFAVSPAAPAALAAPATEALTRLAAFLLPVALALATVAWMAARRRARRPT